MSVMGSKNYNELTENNEITVNQIQHTRREYSYEYIYVCRTAFTYGVPVCVAPQSKECRQDL